MSLDDLHKWDAKYTNREGVPDQPSAALADLANWLPSDGRGLDIAGGAGRNAVWLARRGLKMTVADVSPVGLSLAKQRAADAGVEIEAVCCDLDNPANLPAGPWDLVVVVCFQCRHLIEAIRESLAPEGLFVVVQPTMRNLERHERPSARYLLQEGELRQLADGFTVLHYDEAWLADGRHDAVLVAQKVRTA